MDRLNQDARTIIEDDYSTKLYGWLEDWKVPIDPDDDPFEEVDEDRHKKFLDRFELLCAHLRVRLP